MRIFSTSQGSDCSLTLSPLPEGEDAARRRASLPLRRQEIFNRRHMRSQCRVHRHGATFLTVSRPLALPLCLTYLRASAAPLTATEGKPKGLPPVTRRKGKFFRARAGGRARTFPRAADRSAKARSQISREGSRRTRNAKTDEDGSPASADCWGKESAAVSVSDEVSFGVISGYEPRKLSALFHTEIG